VAVRENEPASLVVSGRNMAHVFAVLRRRPATLAELSAEPGVSKSGVRVALLRLVQAHAVERRDTRFALTRAGRRIAEGLAELSPDPWPGPLDAYRGQWVAVDEDEQVIAGNEDPLELVRELRSRGVRAKGTFRVPRPGEWSDGDVTL
jgi:Family of unknown function (DUF5678)